MKRRIIFWGTWGSKSKNYHPTVTSYKSLLLLLVLFFFFFFLLFLLLLFYCSSCWSCCSSWRCCCRRRCVVVVVVLVVAVAVAVAGVVAVAVAIAIAVVVHLFFCQWAVSGAPCWDLLEMPTFKGPSSSHYLVEVPRPFKVLEVHAGLWEANCRWHGEVGHKKKKSSTSCRPRIIEEKLWSHSHGQHLLGPHSEYGLLGQGQIHRGLQVKPWFWWGIVVNALKFC